MNPKLQKTVREIERAKAKIAEFQALLPGLERQKIDLENTEIVKAVRSVCIAPGEIEAFLEAYRHETQRQSESAEVVDQAAPVSEKNNQCEREATPNDTM